MMLSTPPPLYQQAADIIDGALAVSVDNIAGTHETKTTCRRVAGHEHGLRFLCRIEAVHRAKKKPCAYTMISAHTTPHLYPPHVFGGFRGLSGNERWFGGPHSTLVFHPVFRGFKWCK